MLINITKNKIDNAVLAMQNAGLLITSEKLISTPQNKLTRIATLEKPNKKDGWYKLLYDGITEITTIIYGNWITQHKDKYTIHSQNDKSSILQPIERVKIREHIKASKQQADEREAQEKAKKRSYYVTLFNSFKYCQSHDYLTHKGIDYASRYQFRINAKNQLCIPFVDECGVTHGYQAINDYQQKNSKDNGKKRFCGSYGGYYWRYPLNNPQPELFNINNSFYIFGEGVATCLSAYEAIISYYESQIYLPIILCAFALGNLDKVIASVQSHNLAILYLIDNDCEKLSNAGIETAKMLLAKYKNVEIYPLTFLNGDCNDFLIAYGTEAFIKRIQQYTPQIINKILN